MTRKIEDFFVEHDIEEHVLTWLDTEADGSLNQEKLDYLFNHEDVVSTVHDVNEEPHELMMMGMEFASSLLQGKREVKVFYIHLPNAFDFYFIAESENDVIDRILRGYNQPKLPGVKEAEGFHIIHREDLLQNIAAGLKQHYRTKIANLEVVLYHDDEEVLRTDILTMLDYIANDTYWNEVNDWSHANRAEVRTM